MRKLLALLLLLLAMPASAQVAKGEVSIIGYELQNFTSTSFTYCMSQDPTSLQVLSPGTRLSGTATTSGSSTTVTSFTTGTLVFNPVAVGDILLFNLSGTGPSGGTGGQVFGQNTSGWVERVVTAKASGDSITVDAAIDLSGTNSGITSKFAGYWPYRRTVSCGTGVGAGWFPVHNMSAVNFVLDMTSTPNTLVGGVNANLQCMIGNHIGNPITVNSSANITSFPAYYFQAPQSNTQTPWDYCRIGVQIGTSVTSTSFHLFVKGVFRAE